MAVSLEDGFWVATFHTGQPRRVVVSLGIWSRVKDRLDELQSIAWLQTGLNVTLHYLLPAISVNGELKSWPRRWVIQDLKPVCRNTFSVSHTSPPSPSPDPSPVMLYTLLGIDVQAYGYRARMGYQVFPDGSYVWRIQRDVGNDVADYEGGVDGWKLYYDDATIITSHDMEWEDAPDTGIVACNAYFPEGHPSYPRACWYSYDYVWKAGNYMGYATDLQYTHGHVKYLGVSPALNDREISWARLLVKSDFHWN